MRTKKSTLLKMTLMVCLGQLAPVYGAAPTFTWTATTSGSNLNLGTNWTPVGPPVAGAVANFNSLLPGIDFNPVATAPFRTGEMNFLVDARPFHFTFTNTTLDFTGLPIVGITGLNRDPTLSLTNTNIGLHTPQIDLSGTAGDSFGSAQITVINNSTDINSTALTSQVISEAPYALLDSGASLVIENNFVGSTADNVHQSFFGQLGATEIEALDQVTISCTNSGSFADNRTNDQSQIQFQINSGVLRAHDSLHLTLTNTGESGVNSSGNSFITAFQFSTEEFITGNDGVINISNSGTNSGSGNAIGEIEVQVSSGPFLSNDGLVLSLSNYGENTKDATGTNTVGTVGSDQMAVFSLTTGDNSSLSFTNTGINNGTTSGCNVGTVGDVAQFYVQGGPFLAGDGLKLVATNSGTDGSNGAGQNNVGMTGSQLFFNSSFATGDNPQIQISNSGITTGTTGGSQTVGSMSNGQWLVNGLFTAGDNLNFSASNYGENNDSGGSNIVGTLAGSQAFFSTGSVGNNATFTFTNTGINTKGSSNKVGVTKNGGPDIFNQFATDGPFSAQDNFTFNATNFGSDSSSGTSNNVVGFINAQFNADGDFSVYDKATFISSNSGSNTGSTSNSTIGSTELTDLFVGGTFSAHDDLELTVTNTGTSSGSGSSNFVGCTTGLVYFNQNFVANDRANISLTNTAIQTHGSSTSVGTSFNFGLATFNDFTVGDDLSLTVTNSGTNTSTGTVNNVAVVQGNILSFENVSIGKNGTINVSNFGSYDGTNPITFVATAGNQFSCDNSFSAGENFSLTATNSAVNPNNAPQVARVQNQISFFGTTVFNDGTLIKAVNSGTVDGDQIFFKSPFSVLGKATFEAINTGTVSGQGILINNSAGGDIDIVLQNSSLLVFNVSIGVPFTMGALNGDVNSVADSLFEGFIIDTDPGVNATFEGVMNTAVLIKDGLGTQTFSGTVNSSPSRFISLVNEGVLNITGTFIGSIETRAPGILTGSGTVASGTLFNSGTVLPNKTFTANNFINSGSGILAANVTAQNGNGLLNVLNTATLDGGQVVVGTFDGTYLFYHPYTILTAGNPIIGTFDSVSAVSPLINPFLTYTADSVLVTLKQNISAAAFNHNERAVASVLDGTTNPTLAQSLLLSQLVNLSIPEASAALDSLSGEQYANETFFNENVNRQFIRRLYDPVRFIVACNPCYDPCGDNFTAWLELGGDFIHMRRDTLQGFQVTGGGHMRLSQELLFGLAASYEWDTLSYGDHRGWQTKNSGLVGGYGLYRDDCFYVLADLAYGYTGGSLRREIQIGSATHKTKSHPNSSQVTFYGESGVNNFGVGNVTVQPFVGLEVNSYWRDHQHELGGDGWALVAHKRNRTAAYTRLGLHLTTCDACLFRVSVDAAWDYRCTKLDNRSRNELVSFAGDFEVYGENLARSSFDYAVTIEKDLTPNLNAYIETTGQIYSRANTYTVLGGLSFSW